MDIKSDLIKELSRSCAENGEDLYITADILPCFSELVNTFSVKNSNTAVLLPGAFRHGEGTVCFDRSPVFTSSVGHVSPGQAAVADVRLLGNAEFRRFLSENGFNNFILPFAECADPLNYGYRQSFGWLAEMRAETEKPLHITALFSPGVDAPEEYREVFGSAKATVGLSYTMPEIFGVLCDGEKERNALALSGAVKNVSDRSVILFSTRREAESFYSFALRRGISAGLITGLNSPDEITAVTGKFERYGLRILVATKSLVPSAPFFKADRVIYCGMPYSPDHASRCAALSRDNSLCCYYARTDVEQALAIINSPPEYVLPEDAGRLIKRKTEALFAMREILIKSK